MENRDTPWLYKLHQGLKYRGLIVAQTLKPLKQWKDCSVWKCIKVSHPEIRSLFL